MVTFADGGFPDLAGPARLCRAAQGHGQAPARQQDGGYHANWPTPRRGSTARCSCRAAWRASLAAGEKKELGCLSGFGVRCGDEARQFLVGRARRRRGSPGKDRSPTRRARPAGPCVSTPSTTTLRSSSRARWIIALTTMRSRSPPTMSAMRPRSILIASNGNEVEIGEARIARSEIVHRNPDAGFAKAIEAIRHSLLIDEQGAFGDFAVTRSRIDAGGTDLVEQPALVAGAGNVGRQDVDRDAKTLQRPFPSGGRAQSLALDEPRQPLGETACRRARKQRRRRSGTMAERASASAPTIRPVAGSISGWKKTSTCSWAIAASSIRSRRGGGRQLPLRPTPAAPTSRCRPTSTCWLRNERAGQLEPGFFAPARNGTVTLAFQSLSCAQSNRPERRVERGRSHSRRSFAGRSQEPRNRAPLLAHRRSGGRRGAASSAL